MFGLKNADQKWVHYFWIVCFLVHYCFLAEAVGPMATNICIYMPMFACFHVKENKNHHISGHLVRWLLLPMCTPCAVADLEEPQLPPPPAPLGEKEKSQKEEKLIGEAKQPSPHPSPS